ncbi:MULTISPECIES: barstar family protein [Kitasatospora]|uniref:Barstar family protein n=1 Tax=Kitasatospora cathayae TaxID=3004092 RepID=A0ABY7QCH6_9ACTN|nr:barstar family protein [Kitasatospora sp. HUAS 3-15]WBP90236.1 barstar family protein [Kitasatospora sp. HUAS 3-15]
MTVTYVIDGNEIGTLEDFWDVVGRTIGVDGYFGRNLDAFADCLRGGYASAEDDDYVIEWRNHEVSRRKLGHPETVRQLERRLSRAHPTNREDIVAKLAAARAGKGPTVYDWLVDIIEEQRPGGLRLA